MREWTNDAAPFAQYQKNYITVKFSPAGPEFAMTSKTANRLRRDPAKASSAATGQIGARGDPARPHAVAQELRDVFVLHM